MSKRTASWFGELQELGGGIRNEWDVITATFAGGVIWRRYGDRKIVVTYGDETPDEALARIEREKREQGTERTDVGWMHAETVAGIGVESLFTTNIRAVVRAASTTGDKNNFY